MKKLIIAIIGILFCCTSYAFENLIGPVVEYNGCLYQCIDDIVGWEKQIGACVIFPPSDFVYPAEVTIADSVEIDGKFLPVIYIQNSAFCNHAEVRKVTFGANIAHVGLGAFYLCGVDELVFNDNLWLIDSQAFANCPNLKNVIFPKSNVFLSQSAFLKTELNSIHIKCSVQCDFGSLCSGNLNSVTFDDDAIGIFDVGYYSGFYAGQVTKLDLPGSLIAKTNSYRGVPNLKKISLKAITEDRSRMVIEGGSFYSDAPLEEFVCMDPEPPLVADNMLSENQFATCVLRVPEGCIDAYKAAQGWRNFANIAEMASAPDTEMSASTVVSSEYYDMTGCRITAPKSGSIYIERSLMSDGFVKVSKIAK